MAYEQKDGDIAVFTVKEKKSEKGPDWTGTAIVDGQKLEVSLWAKGSSGTMLAGSIKPAWKPKGGGGDAGGSTGRSDNFAPDEEIPFITCASIW